MRKPLMPKATASWLIENTSLSFKQISNFVGLHILEIQAIADGEVSNGILSRNPLENGELTDEEIQKCEKDEKRDLQIKHYPSIPDSKICKIIGTTKKTVQSIRDRTYWNIQGLRAQNPQELGLCSREELQKMIEKFSKEETVKQ